MVSDDHPWKTQDIHDKEGYAHPNSLYAKARHEPKTLERILDGMREADEDLRLREEWAKRGFVSR